MGFLDKLFKRKVEKPKQNDEAQTEVKPEPKKPSQIIKRGLVSSYKVQFDHNVVDNLKKRYIAFDTETTGLNPNGDKIIEIGAVLFEKGEITKQYGTLVNPGVRIPSAATSVNHITNEMISSAPQEKVVYSNLVCFLGDALNEQTIICAHNANFDISFLSETLMRLGYNAKIYYVDTLSLSRNLVKGLTNYKQDTVAAHFGIINEQGHRAVSDAKVCGKILWELLKLKDEEKELMRQNIEKSRPTDDELEVCAYIQDLIVKNGGDAEWLGFYKNSSNYVDISYLYTIFKFKFAKKGKYIIVEKSALKNIYLASEPCTMSEGGAAYVRVYFESPFELEPLTEYIIRAYKHTRKSALDYFRYNRRHEEEARNSIAMMNSLTPSKVEKLLMMAEKHRNDAANSGNSNKKEGNQEVSVKRTDITINPIHDRAPVESILNLYDWEKGYDAGYQYWEQGDELRKNGDIEAAISLFDKARYNGYCAPVLFESYAMAYHKLKDYDNEIDILDEGIKRERKQGTHVGMLEARRDKAVQLLYKQQEIEEKKEIKRQEALKKAETRKVDAKLPKQPKGRAILQLSDDMMIIKRYETVADAVRETGINSKSIRDAAKGVQKHAGGFVWKYAD